LTSFQIAYERTVPTVFASLVGASNDNASVKRMNPAITLHDPANDVLIFVHRSSFVGRMIPDRTKKNIAIAMASKTVSLVIACLSVGILTFLHAHDNELIKERWKMFCRVCVCMSKSYTRRSVSMVVQNRTLNNDLPSLGQVSWNDPFLSFRIRGVRNTPRCTPLDQIACVGKFENPGPIWAAKNFHQQLKYNNQYNATTDPRS
jgi:hypothetical protein